MNTSYDQARMYDLDTSSYTADLDFWKQISNLEGKGVVAELGCGTGRVTLPLAQSGINIVGMDFSKAMLDLAKQKKLKLGLKKQPRLLLGDMRKCDQVLTERVSKVLIPYNSFQQLLTLEDQLEALNSIRQILLPKGYFMAELAVPAVFKNPMVYETVRSLDSEGILLVRKIISSVNKATQIVERQFFYSLYELEGERKLIEELWVPRNYANIYPVQWEHMLKSTGFDILNKWGNFELGPFGKDSSKMLFLCQKI